jgi:hypothetical protein
VSHGAAEVSGQKRFNQFHRERAPDDFPTKTDHIHVVVFDALSGSIQPAAAVSWRARFTRPTPV